MPVLLPAMLAGCGNKNWSKNYVYEDCMKEMKKDKDAASLFSQDKMEKICDCSAQKTVARYKSEADARKDEKGLMEIGKDCALEILSK